MLRSVKWQFAILVLVAVLVRGGALVMLAPSLQADPDGYRWLSETLAVYGIFGTADENGNTFPTAFRPPAYPWLLSWLVRNGQLTETAVAWLHGILGVATSCLTFWLARRLFVPWGRSNADERPLSDAKATAAAADKRPLLAAVFVAVDPILLVQSAQVMTETFATFLAVAVWSIWLWLVARATTTAERWVAGVALAGVLTVAFFCRPAFLVWAFLLVAWLVGIWLAASFRFLSPLRQLGRAGKPSPAAPASDPPTGRVKPSRNLHQPPAERVVQGRVLGRVEAEARRGQRDFLGIAALILLILGGAVGWWTERNRRAIGHPIWATSHGGYTLLLGNNPLFYDYLRSRQFGRAWQAEPFHRAWSYRYQADPFADGFWKRYGEQPMAAPVVEDEVADDQLAYNVAKATIRQQPTMFVWSSIVRVGNLWSPLPHVTDQRSRWQVWGIAAFYLVVAAFVVAGAWSLRWRLFSSPWIAALLLAIALTAVHAVYWSNLRMRAPAVPWLSLLAATGIERFLHWRHRP